MTVQDVRNLIDLLPDSSGVTELSVTGSDGSSVTLKRQTSRPAAQADRDDSGLGADEMSWGEDRDAASDTAPAETVSVIAATMVGVFHIAPQPIATGAQVQAGQTVGFIEFMKLMNDVVSTATGTIVENLVEDGMPVEYGQVLFRVRPS